MQVLRTRELHAQVLHAQVLHAQPLHAKIFLAHPLETALAGKSPAPACSSTSNLPPSATLQVLLVLTATSIPLGRGKP